MGTITDRESVGWAEVATKTDLRLLAAEITRDVNQRIGELREEMQKMRGDLIRSNHRTTLWIVIAVSTMPQVVAEVLSKF